MNLNEKIKEIRSKPEHIRLRYVYGALAVSMLFILIIWVFSIKNMLQSPPTDPEEKIFSNLKDSFKESLPKEETPSLEKLLEENSQKIKEELEAQEKINSAEEKNLENTPASENSQPPENTAPPATINATP